MGFGQPKLLTPEAEGHLKDYLGWAWCIEEMSATEIAKEFGFGEPGEFENLLPRHVYFYVKRFGFKKNSKVSAEPQIDPAFARYYMKWTPSMPENVVNNLRKYGFLLNDPLEK